MTAFASLILPAAQIRHTLTGPAGPHLDTLVAQLIGAGVDVEAIIPTTAYRLNGPAALLHVLAEELAREAPNYMLQREGVPDGVVSMTSRLASHPYRRSMIVHGAADVFIARAVDQGLRVTTVGWSRWKVEGRTAALAAWLASIDAKVPTDWTPANIAAEDAPDVVNVDVKLPDRRTTSEITRNNAGDIVNIVQLEKDA